MRSRSPISAYDELERAVIDMRERFLSIGEHISGLLATLARQIDAAPAQASIRHAADQIAGTQHRLKAQMARLPAHPNERYQIMRSLLQAQHGALQQLTIIVEQHAPQAAALPYAAPGYARVPPPDAAYDWPAAPRSSAMAGHALADAHFEPTWQGNKRARAPAKARAARRAPRRRRGATIVEIMSSGGLAVLAAMVAAAVCAYVYFPGSDTPHVRDRNEPTTTAASDSDDVATDRDARPDTPIVAGRNTQPLPPGIVLSRPQTGSDNQAEPDKGATALPTALLPSLGAGRARDRAPADGQGAVTSSTSALKPSIAAAESEAAPAEPARLRFVAVVFTHKDRAAALSAFADLQHRYRSLLTQRKAEAQPIEIADKGTWHRLVVLPAGSRQSATGLCDQLQTAGYDRCWVKAY